jgi:hypothetical protein
VAKVKLLFISANPEQLQRLRLDKEIRDVEEKIRVARYGRSFEIISQWAARPNDLFDALLRNRPTIVHFSGHSTKANEIVLEDDDGNVKAIGGDQLRELFSNFTDTVHLVVLNACYSLPQISPLSSIIDCSVGTTSAISDIAGRQFASSFYHALAFGRSVGDAYNLARCQVDPGGLTESEAFALYAAPGVDPYQMVLVGRKSKPAATSEITAPSTPGSTARASQQTTSVSRRRAYAQTHPSSAKLSVDRQSITGLQADDVRHLTTETVPIEIRESLSRFRVDYPDSQKVAFLIMKFGGTKAHENITSAIKSALEPLGIRVVRADDKQYHDDLFPNVLTYIYGCSFGIAVFERIETDEFNPNVALEVGYMFALNKNVCLLKDRTLQTLQADLVGRLYRVFDALNPGESITGELSRWLKDKELV